MPPSSDLLLFFGVLLIPGCVCLTKDGFILPIQRDYGDGEFAKWGTVSFATSRAREGTFVPEYGHGDAEDARSKLAVGGKICRIKAHNKLLLASEDHTQECEHCVMAFTTSCESLKSGGILTIYKDELDNVISMAFSPQEGADLDSDFGISVVIREPATGPAPDTAGFLNKIQEERIKKEKEEKEPKSFFSKYWMYILPVVFFMMMSNAANQQQGNG